jgi:hypothetical protein
MRVLILFVTAALVAGCAGQSTPEATPAPAVAATEEAPTEVKTVDASTLTANEQFCEMRTVTGSIRKQRVCRGRNTGGPEEVVGQEQIRDALQDLEHNHATGQLIYR